MKIPITKIQLDLLSKRNAASEAAISNAKTASLISQQAQDGARQLRTAFEDVVSYLSAPSGVSSDTEFAGIKFGEDGGEYILELIERPKA